MNDRDAGRRTFRRLIASLLTAAGLAGLSSGCAHSPQRTLNSFWTSVTPRQWSSRTTEAPSEPRVSANVPETEPVSDRDPPATPLNASPARDVARNWNPFATRPREPQPEASPPPATGPAADTTLAELHAAELPDANPALGRLNPPSLQRLRTALSLGFETKTEPQPPAGPGQDQARLRVENLLSRSRELAETGELSQARHLAELAQQMSREALLEFAPDAQRPVDLIALLDQQESADDSNPPLIQTTAYASLDDRQSPDAPVTLPRPAPPATPDAVMHVNRASSMADSTDRRESTAIDLQAPEAPADALPHLEVERIPRAELAGNTVRDLTGVAAVRKRFLAAERDSAPPPGPFPSAVPLPAAETRASTPPAIAISWNWPSLAPSRPQPQRSGSLPLTIVLAACSLALLLVGGWMAARRLRRTARR